MQMPRTAATSHEQNSCRDVGVSSDPSSLLFSVAEEQEKGCSWICLP